VKKSIGAQKTSRKGAKPQSKQGSSTWRTVAPWRLCERPLILSHLHCDVVLGDRHKEIINNNTVSLIFFPDYCLGLLKSCLASSKPLIPKPDSAKLGFVLGFVRR
jgi:hypothetical protein